MVQASGGILDLGGNVTSSITAYDIDTASGSVLKIDGAVAPGTTLTFLGASGALELADLSGGVLQGFNGTIAGLNVSGSATAPTNEINIQAPVTNAVLSGSTLTILNGSTTVATLALNGTPVHGAYAVFQADVTLGGEDVFLSNEPPVPPSCLTLAPASDSGNAGDNVTNVVNPVITGTGLVGDTITLLEGATTVGSATVDLSGNWSITNATLAEGLNALTATQTDVYGNVSSASTALNITIDTVPPSVAVLLASDTGRSATDHTTSNAGLSGSAEANGTVIISTGAGVLGTAAVNAAGAWSISPAGLTDGTYILIASETDATGNTGVGDTRVHRRHQGANRPQHA